MKIHLVILAILLVSCLADRPSNLKGDKDDESKEVAKNKKVQHSKKLPAQGQRNSENIYPFVDHQLKEKYWYYLTKACLIYLSDVQKGDEYQFLAIYRNIVGTFLAITTWKNQSTQIQVNTLVRLGNGFAKNSGANYPPVNVRCIHLRYSLGQGEYFIDIDHDGNVEVNGKVMSDDYKKNRHNSDDQQECDIEEECEEFAEYTKKQFWYYLDHADIVHSQVAHTNYKKYCFVTYLNGAGTFLAIGNQDRNKICKVDTFVRMGNGFQEENEAKYKKVSLYNTILDLLDYDE